MTEILSNPSEIKNHRRQPKRPTNPSDIPPATLRGKVIFEMIAHNKRLSFSMIDVGKLGLVGEIKNQGYYIRVPANTTVEVELTLSDSWDWEFVQNNNDFTLATEYVEARYWVHPGGGPKSRTITIQPTERSPENGVGTGRDDEKFNLGIELSQNNSPIKVGIEIDPIVKNPPPVGGKSDTQGIPGPLL